MPYESAAIKTWQLFCHETGTETSVTSPVNCRHSELNKKLISTERLSIDKIPFCQISKTSRAHRKGDAVVLLNSEGRGRGHGHGELEHTVKCRKMVEDANLPSKQTAYFPRLADEAS